MRRVRGLAKASCPPRRRAEGQLRHFATWPTRSLATCKSMRTLLLLPLTKLPAMRSNACIRFRLRVTPGIRAGARLLYYVNVYCLDRWESCYIRVALSVGVEYE